MTPDRYQQIKQIYVAARELEREERAAYLAKACAGDAELRAEVERFLADEQQATAFLRWPAGGDVPVPLDTLDAGEPRSLPVEAFPGYTLVRELSHGGQGVVYQAVQRATKQKVAIKVLLEGPYASPASRRRFEREIELVAQLKHQHIVSVFHAGQTTDGRQFYVMEYVRGTPLTAYVREKKLGLEDALHLFAKVCEAVQYAHQRGVIHRDLKPGNILVDGAGQPKVLDFGLAKWLAAPADSLVSISQHVMGTLPYMSPEQARGNQDEVDTRTDIYSLGVILYELLTGGYPYPVVGQMAVVLRCIAEEEPTPPRRKWRPGTGIGRDSPGRRSFSGLWRRRRITSPIDDEVETIVLKALAKEQGRRYQSASELARDIGRYLAGEAIEARRESLAYVLKMAILRHRTAVAVAVLVLLATTTIVGLCLAYRHARRVATAAEAARQAIIDRSEETAAFAALTSGLHSGIGTNELARLRSPVERVAMRVRAGRGSRDDCTSLIQSLVHLRTASRSLQESGRVSFTVGASPARGVGAEGLAVALKPVLLLDGGSTGPTDEGIVVQLGEDVLEPEMDETGRSSCWITFRPNTMEPGRHLLSARVEARVVPNQPGVGCWAGQLLPEDWPENLQSDPIIMALPELAVTVVEQLPDGYPPALDDQTLCQSFIARISISDLSLSRQADSDYTASVSIRLPHSRVWLPIKLTLNADRAGFSWQAIDFLAVGPEGGLFLNDNRNAAHNLRVGWGHARRADSTEFRVTYRVRGGDNEALAGQMKDTSWTLTLESSREGALMEPSITEYLGGFTYSTPLDVDMSAAPVAQ